jgi:DNA polymerase-3 subunit gamma/tau
MSNGSAYRVLARKYRPMRFAELIGQEAMVRTLTNAIATGRIAHAFILTGVRGVGKTTTARILARALNCVGPDGQGGPTISPCGECEPCRAIAEDRHVDVMEMDAASRTGVDDIRELTDGVRYKPVAARYKIYVIDEVHMLSKNAFNALLKTLEEPPPDVIFIFATTEVHKVPVTVLSRCQRFSLRRVPLELLTAHYGEIAKTEGVAAESAAIALIARAADGSVRDGLSLLDQAIALGGETISESAVREMLGIADRGLVFDLFEAVLKGDAADALQRMKTLYEGGADPLMVLQDLLELTHFLTRAKLVPEAGAEDPMLAGARPRALALAQKLGFAVLARAWQMLLKGIEEVQTAPSPLQAAEMVLVRLAYVADLPAPGELVKQLAERGEGIQGGAPSARPASVPTPSGGGARLAVSRDGGSAAPRLAPDEASAPAPASAQPQSFHPASAQPKSFHEVVELFEKHHEAMLRAHLVAHVHLVHFEPGRIEFRPGVGAPRDLPNRLGQLLSQWTGARWIVSISGEEGAPTLAEQAEAREASLRNEAAQHPLVRKVLETFPGARIEAVREIAAAEAAAAAMSVEEPGEGDESR